MKSCIKTNDTQYNKYKVIIRLTLAALFIILLNCNNPAILFSPGSSTTTTSTTINTFIPDAVTDFTLVGTSSCSASFIWNDVTDEIGYKFYLNTINYKDDFFGDLTVDMDSFQLNGLNEGTTYHVWIEAYSAYGSSPHQYLTFTVEFTPYIGPAGGYVFYDKGRYTNGWRYLESAPFNGDVSGDPKTFEWGAEGTSITGADGTIIGTGRQNTADIVAQLGTGSVYAARVCDELDVNGFDDWFLPSKDELDALYVKLMESGLVTMSIFYYFSSSESGSDKAWRQYFGTGVQSQYGFKSEGYRVRAIRAF